MALSTLTHHDGKVIRVTPTVAADSSGDNEVPFLTTEIPNAVGSSGGTSKLVSCSFTCKQALALSIDVIFMEVDTDYAAAAGGAINISDANLVASKPLGWIQFNGSTSATSLNGNELQTCQSQSADPSLPLILQAASGSTSVYFTAIDRDGGDTFVDGDLTFTFGIQY